MKVPQCTVKHANNTRKHRLQASFSEVGNEALNSIRNYAIMIKEAGPKELVAAMQDLEFGERAAEQEFKTKNEQYALTFGMGIGLKFGAVMAELTQLHTTGKGEHTLNDYIRAAYTKEKQKPSEPPKSQKQIINEGIAMYEKEHPGVEHPTYDTIKTRFPQIVNKTKSNV